jgi:hypothetical protein
MATVVYNLNGIRGGPSLASPTYAVGLWIMTESMQIVPWLQWIYYYACSPAEELMKCCIAFIYQESTRTLDPLPVFFFFMICISMGIFSHGAVIWHVRPSCNMRSQSLDTYSRTEN